MIHLNFGVQVGVLNVGHWNYRVWSLKLLRVIHLLLLVLINLLLFSDERRIGHLTSYKLVILSEGIHLMLLGVNDWQILLLGLDIVYPVVVFIHIKFILI